MASLRSVSPVQITDFLANSSFCALFALQVFHEGVRGARHRGGAQHRGQRAHRQVLLGKGVG